MRRVLLAAALLVVEFLVITVPVDLGAVHARGGAFALLAEYRDLALTLILGACFSLVLAGVVRRNRPPAVGPAAELSEQQDQRRFVRRSVVHALTFALFVLLTVALFNERPTGAAFSGNLALGTWVVLAACNLVTLGRAAIGAEFLSTRYLLPLLMGTLFGGLTHMAGLMSRTLWDALAGATFRVALFFLRAMFPGATGNAEARLLGAGDFYVEVGAPCSGFEGLGVAIVFFPSFLWLLRSRYRFPQALLVVPIGLFLVWVGNALRVAAIVAVGVLGHPGLAVGAFHSKIGWAVLTGICLALAAVSLRIRWLSKDASSEPNAAVAFLTPELLVLLATLLTGLAGDGHDPLYPIRIILGGCALLVWFDKTETRLFPVPAKPVLAGVLVGAIWVVTDRGPEVSSGELPAQPLWRAMRLLGAALVIPICEELAFRGYLMRRLVERDFYTVAYKHVGWVPVLVSSVAFGLVHSRPVLAALSGLVFAWLARGGLGHAIWAHGAANLAIGVWVLSSGESWHW